jgi:GT2 family glycosyltransferase
MICLTYIILHYKNTEDTLKCVQSVLSTQESSISQIIIVDNGSNDGSGDTIFNYFKNTNNVLLITNTENLGFANGFNEGIRVSKKNFPDNFVVLLNNDTEILTRNWNEIISSKYSEYSFHVMGPDIIDLDGNNGSNPRKHKIYNLLSINFMLLKMYFQYYLSFLRIDVILIYIKVSKIFKSINKKKDVIEDKKDLIDVELHGSCLILSKNFVNRYGGLYDKTFLYFEESILKYIAERDGLIMVYTPELKILHKEYGATKIVKSSKWNRKKFQLYHGIQSRKVLRKLMIADLKKNER